MADPIVVAEELHKSFGDTHALRAATHLRTAGDRAVPDGGFRCG